MNNPYKELYEAKDKEIYKLMGNNAFGYYEREFDKLLELKYKMEGFDEGAKTMRKEILDKIDKINIECKQDAIKDNWLDTQYYKGFLTALVNLKKELKQSLEEKK